MTAKTKASEIAIGLVFAAGGLGICLGAAGLRSMPGMVVGSGLFPMITGALMGLFGLVLALAALLRPAAARPEPVAEAAEAARGPVQLYSVAVLAGLIALTALMPAAGFLLGAALFTGFAARLGGAGWIGSAVFAVLLTAVLYWVFVYGLRVQLPRGLWGF
jgi:small-conductance mechanosensitive channel